jgi:microcystin degradation protein MlrC
MPRIALAGFHHETNTFAPVGATYDDFVMEDAWPGLTRGEAILETFRGKNIGMAGFLDAARGRDDWTYAPALWCQAGPSAHPTEDAYERVAGEMLDRLAASRPFDALYLCLHGAMVPAHLEDGEGELLSRIRALVGPDLPIVCSLDLHANVTEAMWLHADAMTIYRTYPHIDMAATGAKAFALLADILRRGAKPAKAFRKLPFIIPITQQCTLIEPCRSIYGGLAALEGGDVASLSVATGFPPADMAENGPAVVAYGWKAAAVEAAASAVEGRILAAEPHFAGRLWSAAEAVAHARALSAAASRPIVLADTQDNPGAGANSDSVGVLEELVRQKAEGAVFGLLYDPDAARAAHAAGIGGTIERGIGCVSNMQGHRPFAGRFAIEAVSDGVFAATGPMYAGFTMRLGPMAVLRVESAPGVRVVLSSKKQQLADQSMLAHLGIEPARQKIIALKSSVHFRNHFQELAHEILVVAAPGPNVEDPAALPFRRLRRGVRLRPLGPTYTG